MSGLPRGAVAAGRHRRPGSGSTQAAACIQRSSRTPRPDRQARPVQRWKQFGSADGGCPASRDAPIPDLRRARSRRVSSRARQDRDASFVEPAYRPRLHHLLEALHVATRTGSLAGSGGRRGTATFRPSRSDPILAPARRPCQGIIFRAFPGHCPAEQQARAPAAQALPAFAPHHQPAPGLDRTVAVVARRHVAGITRGDQAEHRIDSLRQLVQLSTDAVRAADQVGHEAVQVIDQLALAGHRRAVRSCPCHRRR